MRTDTGGPGGGMSTRSDIPCFFRTFVWTAGLPSCHMTALRMDNFIVSARKYRPATFESVVGQSHITSTLRNAIARGQLAHAYLFCGPRGVGKTTCARIFAKTINCLNPQGSEACGECESCRAFDEGRSFNIHELDAASNNSVDDIRTLTEQVRIPPQIGRYSVYIIDEVHMLSQAAFNAFLKTLEEPPAHAVFILATTEKHKIIPTILSRCQIYDFNRIRVEDGVAYLKYIAEKEGITYDDESLNLIAAKADGGMRDALSMFDKAVAFCGTSLDFREVARTLNVLDYDTYFNLTDLAAAGDYRSALLLLDDVLRKGFSAQTFTGGLAAHLRDLLMCKDAATAPLLEATGTLLERYKAQSARLEIGFLFDAVALINGVDATLRSATNTRLHVELGLMKLCGMGQKKNSLEPDGPQLPPLTGGTAPRSVQTPGSAGQSPVGAAAGQYPSSVPPHEGTAATQPVSEPARPAPQHTASPAERAATQTPPIPQPTKETERPLAPPAGGNDAPHSHTPAAQTTPEPAAAQAAKPAGRSVSGVSIHSILKGGTSKEKAAAGEPAATAARQAVDPDSQQKITAAKETFIAELGRRRPRFATAFANMEVTGNTIRATVSTDLLRDDIIQHQKELISLLRDISGLDGTVVFDIEVKEDRSAVRPVKPEDKLAHLRSKNAALDELRRELELELE